VIRHLARGSVGGSRRAALLVGASLGFLAGGPDDGAAQGYPVAHAPASTHQAAIDSTRAMASRWLHENAIPGASLAVAVDGEVVWEEGFGFADLENRVGVRPETRFRIASISKALTAASVGKLVEEGRLDLDAPIQRYVPSFPEKEQTVTTRLTAGHLAGFRHYRGDEFASAVQYDDVVDALEIFENDPLQSVPGEEYSYSTYGWNLVSAIVQGAAGRSFLSYMRHAVIEPLGMDATVAEHVDSIIPNRARFYLRGDDGRLINATFVNNSNKWAGGGYLSTAGDMVAYASAYLDPGFLAPETVELLWTSMRTSDGEETGYGIGWRVGERDGRREIHHTGGAMGGSTVLILYPDDGVAVAVLTNVGGAPATAIARPVARLFMGRPSDPSGPDAGAGGALP